MKKTWRIILLVALAVSVIGIFLQANKIIAVRIAGTSMQPDLPPSSIVLVSKWKTYNRGDIVSIKPFVEKGDEKLYRLVALEGDTVEVNDSYFLLNGLMVDNTENLRLIYYVKRRLVYNLTPMKAFLEGVYGDTLLIGVSKLQHDTLSRNLRLHRYGTLQSRCFGPMIVPKGTCFLLGDNRDACRDSRHFGCIPVSMIEAVKL